MKSLTRLEDLQPDQRNANKGTARGASLLEDSIRRNGFGRPIIADKNGNIIGGNKTHERAVELGLGIKVVDSTGHDVIVHRRLDLDLYDPDDKRARELAFADNRIAELDLAWDRDEVLAARDFGIELERVGFRDDEIAALADAAEEPITETETGRKSQKTERLIEIRCTAHDADAFESTLQQWGRRPGVSIQVFTDRE